MPTNARTTVRNPYRPTTRNGAVRNPFRNVGRCMILIVLPPACALVALIAAWYGPDQAAIFGWNPVHATASNAHWCAEMRMTQVSPELQAHVDAVRITEQYTQLCG